MVEAPHSFLFWMWQVNCIDQTASPIAPTIYICSWLPFFKCFFTSSNMVYPNSILVREKWIQSTCICRQRRAFFTIILFKAWYAYTHATPSSFGLKQFETYKERHLARVTHCSSSSWICWFLHFHSPNYDLYTCWVQQWLDSLNFIHSW